MLPRAPISGQPGAALWPRCSPAGPGALQAGVPACPHGPSHPRLCRTLVPLSRPHPDPHVGSRLGLGGLALPQAGRGWFRRKRLVGGWKTWRAGPQRLAPPDSLQKEILRVEIVLLPTQSLMGFTYQRTTQ